ncbi:HupE/UreJ family protein [Tsuneonella sp. SYSU-LHT278]|uniref:HupE/UreJ family protein n=1 Tax=Tsuneonella sediminis TaxID=3416089 RepID=UPI003F7AE0A4
MPAGAHLTPNSEIVLMVGEGWVRADITVPQGEYAYATGNPVGPDRLSEDRARSYLSDHLRVTSPEGRLWSVRIDKVEFKQIAGPPDLHAVASLVPPRGTSAREFVIEWTVLLNELPGHFALFLLGEEGREPHVLGALRSGSTTLAVDVARARPMTVLIGSLRLGIEHILHGYDHLLFLIALLLPAPLVAEGGRWSAPRPMRGTLLRLAAIVTAFTIGHSVTLVGATLGGWRLPVAPVEIAIAVSVLLSAIHALRPLIAEREHYIALAFGLVHGLAFATLLSDAEAGAASTAASLLGFNLGIEIVQLSLAAAVVPPLVVLARAPWFGLLRKAIGGIVAVVALTWIANRTLGTGAALVGSIDALLAHGIWAIAVLYVLALIHVTRRVPRRAKPG